MSDDYMFRVNDERAELDRLQLQEQNLDWVSIGRLVALGLHTGHRCLEAGVGAGSMARWMATTVGPTGRVVGVDLSDTYFGLCDGISLELRRADLLTTPLEAASYDFVHGRLVLMHLAPDARAALLQRFLDALRPGGWIVVVDTAFGIRPVPANGDQALWYQLLDVTIQGSLPRADFALGVDLPAHLASAGFVDVDGWGFFGLTPHANAASNQYALDGATTVARFGLHHTTGLMTDDEVRATLDAVQRGDLVAAIPLGMAWGRRPD